MAVDAPAAGRSLRARHAMPPAIRSTLAEHGLRAAYDARPAYQRNDYLGWIARAKRDVTRDRRVAQMLAELEQGDVYMKMAWRPKAAAR